jgi:hypothetical protein
MQVHPYLALVLRKTLTLAIYIRTQYDYLFFHVQWISVRYCKNASLGIRIHLKQFEVVPRVNVQ